MKETRHVPPRMRWALFRFGVVSPLLTSPPEPGELAKVLDELAARPYQHPVTRLTVRIGRSTLERWFYTAKNAPGQPVEALERKVHALAGKHPTVHDALRAAIEAQYRAHPRWSFKLHHDNLLAQAKVQPENGPVPSICVLRRFMKGRGLTKQKMPRRRRSCAEHDATFQQREKRSFEVGHVHGLWHSDFHECSRGVVTEDGEWKKPVALAFLDDCSRAVCHMQWYMHEDAQSFVHGFSQAILKRGLCRKLLTDNGKHRARWGQAPVTRNDFIALVLHATEDTIDMLERAVRHDGSDCEAGDPAANTVLLAVDQLAFALVRYRAQHQIPKR
jgi:putative transposase